MPSQIPKKGQAVKFEPFDHLIQHIKQADVRLWEALHRGVKYFTEIQTKIDNGALGSDKFDKATFGIQKSLVIVQDLTLHYICRRGGLFIDCTVNNKVAPDSTTNSLPTILDIEKSTDDGATWVSLFNTSTKITIPHGSTSTLLIPQSSFGIPSIAVPNLLRVNCVQVAVPNPGQGFEIVLRWNKDGVVED